MLHRGFLGFGKVYLGVVRQDAINLLLLLLILLQLMLVTLLQLVLVLMMLGVMLRL